MIKKKNRKKNSKLIHQSPPSNVLLKSLQLTAWGENNRKYSINVKDLMP